MKNHFKIFTILFMTALFVPVAMGSKTQEFKVLDLIGVDIDQMSDAEIEQIDIDALMEELTDIIQHYEDVRKVDIVMNSIQHGSGMRYNVTKTPGQAFGQNDGYVYGNFGQRVAQTGGGRGGPGGGGPGGPRGGFQGGQGDFPGGPGGGFQGGQGDFPGGRGDTSQGGFQSNMNETAESDTTAAYADYTADTTAQVYAAAAGRRGGPGGVMGGPGGGPGGRMGGPGGRGPGGGGSLDFHPLTTPVIEVAADGQTAKGIWYDPGVLAEQVGGGGQYMASWIFECYSMDFVKEDAQWKNWHRCLSTDFFISPNDNWINTRYTKAGQDEIARIGGILERTQSGELEDVQAPEGSPAGQSFKDIKMVAYQSWTRETMPQYKPMPPVPYTTFEETFSYVPPMPEDIEQMLIEQDMMY